jgi:anti-anti-sigma regulatory factor
MLSPGLVSRTSVTQQEGGEMEISRRSVGGVTILNLSGPIKGGRDGNHLVSALTMATSPVVLNLSGVQSIDREGLGLILAGYRSFVYERDGHIVLAELSSTIDDLSRDLLMRMLIVHETEAAAVAALQGK